MTEIKWDQVGDRRFETGVDHGILFRRNSAGEYYAGYAWNGLTAVTESPSGAESSKQYADNIVYLNLVSAEDFGGTIEAFTSPQEFDACDGTATPYPGVAITQQARETFGLYYRTKVGNDVSAELGYKHHFVYGALAAPSEKSNSTVNETTEPLALSWEFSTTPVDVPGFKPSAHLSFDSTKVNATALAALLAIVQGTAGTDPRLPLPAEIFGLFSGTLTETVQPTAPTYNSTTKVLTIPTVTGVVYQIDGKTVTGTVTLTKNTVVTAKAAANYKLPAVTDDDWLFVY